MSYTTLRTERFEEDLDGCLAYLMGELKSPHAALSLINEVERVLELLGDNPFINSVSDRLSFARFEYREHQVKKYVVLYRVEGDAVIVSRLFHQSHHYERFVMEW